MDVRALNARLLVEEYETLVIESSSRRAAEIDWARLHNELVRTAEWTDGAATRLIELARTYGAFMLRNALALAVAAGIEDGTSGI